MRRSHRCPATFRPSHEGASTAAAAPPAALKAGPQLVKSFGSGIRAINRWTHPEGSNTGLFGSRPNTLNDCRSPVAAAGLTGLPATSTVGLFDMRLAFCTPGKNANLISNNPTVDVAGN